jgi:disulfide bond formation protein DsbB
MPHWRAWHATGFTITAVMLVSVLYLQVVEFVLPCLLCVYLRVITLFYCGISLIAIIHKPKYKSIYLNLLTGISAFGACLASYLFWLQLQPTGKILSCDQGIGAKLANWPFGETLTLLFASYGDCSEMVWTESLPLLALIGFVGLFIFDIIKRTVLLRY